MGKYGLSAAAKLSWIAPYFRNPKLSIEEILEIHKPIVLCLGSTSTGEYINMPIDVMRFAFTMLLSSMRRYALKKGLGDVRWMLIVDEGHIFLYNPPMRMEPEIVTVARILRKFGLSTVLITHDWSEIPPQFRRLAGWKLALSHSDVDYVELTTVYMGLNRSEKTWFSRGIRGRAVLKRGVEPHNILVEIEPIQEAMTHFWWKEPPEIKQFAISNFSKK